MFDSDSTALNFTDFYSDSSYKNITDSDSKTPTLSFIFQISQIKVLNTCEGLNLESFIRNLVKQLF